jgi:hypothetical protein
MTQPLCTGQCELGWGGAPVGHDWLVGVLEIVAGKDQ